VVEEQGQWGKKKARTFRNLEKNMAEGWSNTLGRKEKRTADGTFGVKKSFLIHGQMPLVGGLSWTGEW